MNIEQVKDTLSKEEGVEPKPYYDTKHILTIGVGHNMIAKPLPENMQQYLNTNGQITMEMVDQLLEADINDGLKDCYKLFPEFDSFSENRQQALFDVTYNMGEWKIQNGFPRFVHNVNIGDWEGAGKELEFADGKGIISGYVKDVGVRAYHNIQLLQEG